jgi:hypothetical protein
VIRINERLQMYGHREAGPFRSQHFITLRCQTRTTADMRRGSKPAARQVLGAGGEITGEVAERLQRIARILGVEDVASASPAA